MKVILRQRTKNDFFSSFLGEIGLQVLPLGDIFFLVKSFFSLFLMKLQNVKPHIFQCKFLFIFVVFAPKTKQLYAYAQNAPTVLDKDNLLPKLSKLLNLGRKQCQEF